MNRPEPLGISRHQRTDSLLVKKKRLGYTKMLAKILKKNAAANPACHITDMDIDGLAMSIESRQHSRNRGEVQYSTEITRFVNQIEDCTQKRQLFPALQAFQRANNIENISGTQVGAAAATASANKRATTGTNPPKPLATESNGGEVIVISDDSEGENESVANRGPSTPKRIVLLSVSTQSSRGA